MGVVAETDSLFLVTLNMQTVRRDGTDPDGRPIQQPYTTRAVCLIPKEAYWNSLPEMCIRDRVKGVAIAVGSLAALGALGRVYARHGVRVARGRCV